MYRILAAKQRVQQKGRLPRKSVSAEAYGNWNKKENFIAHVIPKSEEAKEAIKKKIVKSFMFSNLNSDDLDVVINAMKIVNVSKDDWVIKEGDDGNDLYVVGLGEYSCTKVFPGNTVPTFLRYYKQGEVFGELCLLYNCPRAASIQSNTEGVLYALDRETFTHIVKDSSVKRRQKYEEFLSSIELLQGMDEYERVSLSDAVIEETYSKGNRIINQGEEGIRFYFILEGEAIATKRLEPGKAPVEVMQYKKGSYFGELALIHDAPRAANVIAKTDLKLVSLDKETFKRIMGSAEELLQRNIATYENYNQTGGL